MFSKFELQKSVYYHRIHLYYKTSLSIVHFLHIILLQNIFTSHNSSSHITYLAAATHDNNIDSIVDQDVHVVLAGIANHSFLSLQALQGDILDDDLDQESDNANNDHLGVEYNATVYDGGKKTVPTVCQAGISGSPILANVAASIAPDLSTLSSNELIAAANEVLRVQKSLKHEVAALQQTMLSMRNQSQINSSAISGYQEGALWANHWLKRKGRIYASLVLS